MQGVCRFVRTSTAPDGAVQGHFQATGVRPRFLNHLANQGIKIPGHYFDPSQPLWSPMFDFHSIYLFYRIIGLSAAMLAEGVYLLVYNNASYRKKINRRLKVMSDKTDRVFFFKQKTAYEITV